MANAAQGNYSSSQDKVNVQDCFGTPPYATRLVVPWLMAAGVQTIWESACGVHNFMVDELRLAGFRVIPTDLITGNNRFHGSIERPYDAEVTNPPYGRGVKWPWCEIAFSGARICCLLLPTAFIEAKTGQALIKKHKLQFLIPDDRIDFHTPFKGWDSHAQFHSSWVCKGLNLPDQFNFVEMNKPKKGRKQREAKTVMGTPVQRYLER